ncbi:MAG: RNA-directed DNA polymerase, partial [Planctomycetes bacterium]|nr:RNA-directed DNA polymerase [Planctomycetota bacterium]
MGFFTWLFRWLGWGADSRDFPSDTERTSDLGVRTSSGSLNRSSFDDSDAPRRNSDLTETAIHSNSERSVTTRPVTSRPKLTLSRREEERIRNPPERSPCVEVVGETPYRYARFGSTTGRHLDLSQDGDDSQLNARCLPIFHTPEELAGWLQIPLNQLVWLVHRFSAGRPPASDAAHYVFQWLKKKSGGWRLIESPKPILKRAQVKILREILDRIPAHRSAHGFVAGRSIVTNAEPHVGQDVVVAFDLSNFYTTVGFSRVVAIFRSLGYSREAAIWLGLLTTSAIPGNMAFPERNPYAFDPYLKRHLPQGAPTSPALANLSAFGLDVRLTGLARSFGATYTRYADDISL